MANDVEAMMDLYEQGESLRSIGKQFGLSHERVRQLFEKADPEFSGRVAIKRQEQLNERKRQKAAEIQAERDRPKGTCRICDGPITRPNAKYACSEECQDTWNKIRFHIDEDIRRKHILAAARVIMKNPTRYKDAQVNWANQAIVGNWSYFGKHKFVEGSLSHQAYVAWCQKYGHTNGTG